MNTLSTFAKGFGKILPVTVFFLVAGLSCAIDTWDLSMDCYYDKPTEAEVSIKVSLNEENLYRVPLIIYFGKYPSDSVVYRDTATNLNYTIFLPVGHYYSVQAEYKSGSRTIYAIDGSKLEIEKNYDDESGDLCYNIRGDKLNATLKY